MSKRTVLLWASYDFANSIAMAAFLLHFPQWLVVDQQVSDLWYNMIFVASSALLVLTAPVISLVVDRSGHKMKSLRLTTLGELIFLVFTAVLTSYFAPSWPLITLAIVCFLISNYFHQFASVFYNALLPSVAGEKSEGWVSGFGMFANFAGIIAGLAIAIPLASSSWPLLGAPGRTQTFLPAAIISSLLIIPSLLMSEPQTTRPAPLPPPKMPGNIKSVLELLRIPGLGAYLMGYFLFSDAIITVQGNMPIYMAQVLGIPDKEKSFILGATLGASAIGALAGGRIADRVGFKRTLLGILGAWTVLLPMLGLSRNVREFTVMVLILGALFGMTLTVTRATMAHLAPSDRQSYAFSYHTIAERFATFVGPLVWGGLTTALFSLGAVRYRIALLAMTIFVLAGMIAVFRMPSDRKSAAPSLELGNGL
jgi:UMF1 family MFS transporter